MDRQELSNIIKSACNIMRQKGKLIPLQYVEQLSWLLFLKLFDNLEEQKKLLHPEYESLFKPKYQWHNWAKKYTGDELKRFVNEDLIPGLSSLTGTPQKAKIGSIFSEISNYMKSGYALAELVQLLDKIDFSKSEDTQILSIVYEELLMYTAGQQGGGAGEFYTPRPIIRFMINVIQPKIGDKILDPFCGSAGFLVESYKFLREKAKTLKEHKTLQEETFYGQEAKGFPYLVGTMNCMLHGIESPNISFLELGTFAEDIRSIPDDKRVDVILTNPPFGGEEDKKLLANFPIKTGDTELAGLFYCMRKLKVKGQCGIVQPEGILFRTSGAYLQAKKELLQNFNLHTIISLPSGVFANVSPKGGSGPKTNLLFFEKGIPTKEIWYYEHKHPLGLVTTRYGRTVEKTYSRNDPILDEHLDDAYKKWQKREISENSWIVKVEDIIKQDYDLSAKNPNKAKGVVYKKPEVLTEDIAKKENQINKLINEVVDLLKKSS